jgi:hypothetical protein
VSADLLGTLIRPANGANAITAKTPTQLYIRDGARTPVGPYHERQPKSDGPPSESILSRPSGLAAMKYTSCQATFSILTTKAWASSGYPFHTSMVYANSLVDGSIESRSGTLPALPGWPSGCTSRPGRRSMKIEDIQDHTSRPDPHLVARTLTPVKLGPDPSMPFRLRNLPQCLLHVCKVLEHRLPALALILNSVLLLRVKRPLVGALTRMR